MGKLTLARIVSVIAIALFAVATVWINYEVKVTVQGGRGGTAVGELGSVKLGQPAPDFSLSDLSNSVVSLNSFHGRQVVLLDFWATWCAPCRMEMVELQSLLDKYKGNGLVVLSLNQGEAAEDVKRFMDRKKYGFHALLDANGAVGNKYGVRAIPSLVLVDKNGVVQWIQVGYENGSAQLEAKVRDLINK